MAKHTSTQFAENRSFLNNLSLIIGKESRATTIKEKMSTLEFFIKFVEK
jgi:hypothetical protein